MRRKIKPIDPSELFDADDINKTTIKDEMRKLYEAIHQKLSAPKDRRWSARDMVKWLDERGVSMSVELFRVYLNELDHEQGYSRSKNKFHEPNKTCSTPAITKPHVRKSIPDGDELTRPPGITNGQWSEMQAKVAAAKRKKTLNSGE